MAIKPLPKLPIVRNNYVSQELVDEITDWLEENKPESIELMLHEETQGREGLYHINIDDHIVAPIAKIKKHKDILDHPLKWVDLCYELSRRWRKAADMVEVPVMGIPLAPSVDGEYPEFPSTAIMQGSIHNGFTQENVEEILSKSYEESPEIWFNYSEAQRRNMVIGMISAAMYMNFKNLIEKPGLDIKLGAASSLCNEAGKRLFKLCEITDTELKIMILPEINLTHH